MCWDLYKRVSTIAQVDPRLKHTVVKKLQFKCIFLKNNWKIQGTYFYRLSYDWLGHIQACNRKTTLPRAFDRLHVCQFHKCCKLEGTIKKVFELFLNKGKKNQIKIRHKNLVKKLSQNSSQKFVTKIVKKIRHKNNKGNIKNIGGIPKKTKQKLNIFTFLWNTPFSPHQSRFLEAPLVQQAAGELKNYFEKFL